MHAPLCFVLMPAGRKSGGSAGIDFDAVYDRLAAPAIEAAGLQPLRAEAGVSGGTVPKPVLENFILCPYAVVDVTDADAGLFYALGLRHGLRRNSTVLLFAKEAGLSPLEAGARNALPYAVDRDGGPANPQEDGGALESCLRALRPASADSPLFELVEAFPDIQRLKTDVFRERVRYDDRIQQWLSEARSKNDVLAVKDVAGKLAPIADREAAVIIDLLLSFRAVKAWEEMIALIEQMAAPLAAAAMVQEQLGMALNRVGRRPEAEKVLTGLIDRRGPSSETCGLLGRVYKDAWEAALRQGDDALARQYLGKAVEAYLKGFESDWRDAYPGINAVTLMEIAEPADERRHHLIPVVTYAVERRMAAGKPDYWDYATLVELAVLAKDEAAAAGALDQALGAVREPWEPEATARNLALIRRARRRRNDAVAWAHKIEQDLLERAGK